jgi:hypothetical protein
MSCGAAGVQVEGAATGEATVDSGLGAVVVEAQHGGILKLRFTNHDEVINAQRTIIVRPWTQASLEGGLLFASSSSSCFPSSPSPSCSAYQLSLLPGAMFTQDSGETVQLKERPDVLSRFAFEQGGLVLSFSDTALQLFAKGGLLTLIDFYR